MSQPEFRGLHHALLKFAYDQGSSVNVGYDDDGGLILVVPRVEAGSATGRTWRDALEAMRVSLIAAGHPDLNTYHLRGHTR